jgi:hypothetical protein
MSGVRDRRREEKEREESRKKIEMSMVDRVRTLECGLSTFDFRLSISGGCEFLPFFLACLHSSRLDIVSFVGKDINQDTSRNLFPKSGLFVFDRIYIVSIAVLYLLLATYRAGRTTDVLI